MKRQTLGALEQLDEDQRRGIIGDALVLSQVSEGMMVPSKEIRKSSKDLTFGD